MARTLALLLALLSLTTYASAETGPNSADGQWLALACSDVCSVGDILILRQKTR
jgi:hypothetical protein